LRVLRNWFLGAAVLLAVWGVVVAVTGGIDTRIFGVPIRSRDPLRALLTGGALFLIASIFYRDDCTRWLDSLGAGLRRYAALVVALAAAALAAHGVAFGTFSAGGADAFGYVNQAYDWAERRLPAPQPVTMTLPFETSDAMQAPLGYRPGVEPRTIVPTYAPGLPLLMSLALAAGACGPFLVVPLFAALFVWFTFRLGARTGGPAVGVVAAVVLTTSPVVLFQALWPMSDIPSGAIWTAALVFALRGTRRGVLAAGLWAALGLLVRPNLPLVAGVPLVAIALGAAGRERWLRAALYCAPLAVVAAAVAAINTTWYGGAFNTGYGSTGELYRASNVWPNLKLNAAWLWESQSPWLLLVFVAWLPPFGRSIARRVLAIGGLLALATLASYASYAQFEVWWYLRLLMPAFGIFAVFVAAGLVGIARTMPQPFGRIAAAAALCAMTATTVSFAAGRGVFGEVRAGESRYVTVGEFAADRLPATAAIFAVQHGGSLRFYSGRPTLRFDWVRPEWAPRVVAAVQDAGYHPYVVVDDWEIPQLRQQFGIAADAPLPWPIVARMRDLGGVTIFDLAANAVPPGPTSLEFEARAPCDVRPRAR
jgi:hypothetical protein